STERLDRPDFRPNNRGGRLMVPRFLEWFDTLMTELVPGTSQGVPPSGPRERKREVDVDGATHGDRLGEPISRIVGVYQIVLRRTLEHFFPGAQIEAIGDRSLIDWAGSPHEAYYRLHDDSSGLGVEIEWLGTHLAFQ